MTTDPELDLTVDALYIHPVKGCAAQPVESLSFREDGGAEGDRGWAIVDERFEVTWQGAHPRLAHVRPTLASTALLLQAPDSVLLAVAHGAPLAPAQVSIWNERERRADVFSCDDAGDAVARWLRQVTGAPLRLVRLGEAARRRDTLEPLHLVTRASADAVDSHLATEGLPAADVRRYRPNVVLRGTLPAFEEEHVRRLDGARVQIELTGPCVRCVVPNVDPDEASTSPAVLDTLTVLSARRRPHQPVGFGVYGRATPGAVLRLGDVLTAEHAF